MNAAVGKNTATVERHEAQKGHPSQQRTRPERTGLKPEQESERLEINEQGLCACESDHSGVKSN